MGRKPKGIALRISQPSGGKRGRGRPSAAKKEEIVTKSKKAMVKSSASGYLKLDDKELEKLRSSVIETMLTSLNDNLGDVTKFYKLSDANVPTRLKRVVPTFLPSFNLICARTPNGACGLPIGRQIEMFSSGPGVGKTSLAIALGAAAQRRAGWIVNWIEGESKLDPIWAETLGMDTNSTIFSQPKHLEDLIDVIENVIDNTPERNDLPKELRHFGTIIVVDSIASFPTKKELEGTMDDRNVGEFQRKFSQAERRITSNASKRNIIILWINQTRDKIGFGFGHKSGPGKITYGGNAIKFHCAQRWNLWCQKGKKSADGIPRGVQIGISNVKNNCGVQSFLQASVYLDFRKGFDYMGSWIDAMTQLLIIKKVKNSIEFLEGKLKGHRFSHNKLREMYEENPSIFFEYENLMSKHIANYDIERSKTKAKKNKEAADNDSEESPSEDS